MALSNGTDGKWLWKGIYKINHDDGGFTFTIWLADQTLLAARTAGELIGEAIRLILPVDAEIYRATLHRWDTKRNAFKLNDVQGAGEYGSHLAVPVVLKCDNPRTALKIRMETLEGNVVPRKFNLIPDAIVAAADLVDAIAPVVGKPAVLPTPVAGTAVYADQMNYIMQLLVFLTANVKKGPIPGGLYSFEAWENANIDHVSVKKGGHVFTG